MRRIFFRVSVALFTFAVSFLYVWTANEVNSRKVDPVVVDEAKTYWWRFNRPRFSPSERGCGKGNYYQSYETDDDQQVVEGLRRDPSHERIRQEIIKKIQDAKYIIERIPNYPDSPERTIIVNKANIAGNESVSILWYDGGDSYRFINAPSLELALEFEKYLTSIGYPWRV